MVYPKISFVIPCYKNPKKDIDDLKENISFLNYPQSKIETVFIDVSKFPKKIGYGEAANIGIGNSKSEYILLINPDVKIQKDSLKILINYLTKHPEVVIVGPKVYSLDNPQEISSMDLPVLAFDSFWGRMVKTDAHQVLRIKNPRQVAWISGSCMLIKREIWEKIGGFDESYFMYWEDADFCLRARNSGFKTVLVPSAIIWHKGGQSIGEDNPERIYYIKRNSLYFIKKFSSAVGLTIELAFTLPALLIKIFRGENRYIKAVLDFLRRQK